MGETGSFRFPASLDPSAEEFRPRNPNHQQQVPSTQIYYPSYLCPYTSGGGVQPLPFYEAAPVVGVSYPQLPSPPVYVSPPFVMAPPVPPQSPLATRTLVLTSVPAEFVSESSLRMELEAFGEVRGIETERLREGIVTVHFYDLRHAEAALTEIRNQHMLFQARLRNHFASLVKTGSYYPEMELYSSPPLPPPSPGLISGRAVWAHFAVPAANVLPDGHNQGTLVIFNLASEVSSDKLTEIFEAFGPVKEFRGTPTKKNQRFVEFYDVRDAAKALNEMNGKEINGKFVVIEFSRPGGLGRKFLLSQAISNTNNVYHKKSVSVNYTPSVATIPPPLPREFSGRFGNNPIPPRSRLSQTQYFSPKKLVSNKGNHKGNRNSLSGNANVGYLGTAIVSMGLGESDNRVVGNGVEEKCLDGYAAPPKRVSKKSHSNQAMIFSSSTKHQQTSKCSIGIKPWKGKQARKFDTRFLIKEDSIAESNCRDPRTTVMIKNIPNKYSQKLLLNMLDNHCIHCNEQIGDGDNQPLSSYDFVYLPIDFNNKCNVGYGFVNMTSPEATMRLYKAFNHQHWEVFNSRKICEVAYARVQGLEALKEHFKNSKFPCEMDHYLPVAFSPPRDGSQQTEPLPIVGLKPQQPVSIDTDLPNPKAGDGLEDQDSPRRNSDDVLSSSSSQKGDVAEVDEVN